MLTPSRAHAARVLASRAHAARVLARYATRHYPTPPRAKRLYHLILKVPKKSSASYAVLVRFRLAVCLCNV
eukprot:g66748.t1